MNAEDLVGALVHLSAAVADLEAAEDHSTELDPIAQAGAIALVKDLRQRLGAVESGLAERLGKAEGQMAGNLPDGRQFTLKRTQDRKEWDHEEWKRDVRRAIVQGLPKGLVLVDTDTGDEQPLGPTLQVLLADAQSVHGSAEPKSTALKPLGLYKGDYCTSSPGGWILNAIKPTPPTETTTEQDPTDA